MKWGVATFLALTMGVVAAAIIGYFVLLRTVPPSDATIALSGVSVESRVVFDRNGVPHIEAPSFPLAARLLGYVHARDRLWQMEFLRRVGQGQLAEVFGREALDADRFLRTLDLAGSAKASFEHLREDTQTLLNAYAQGVNDWSMRDTRLFEPTGGVEFLLLGNSPEAWAGWHSILALKVMGLTLGTNMDREIQRLAMASRGFNPREISDVLFSSPRDNPPPLPDLRSIFDFDPLKIGSGSNTPIEGRNAAFSVPTGQFASNNWVVSGARTESGKPVLANDPHLGLAAPSVFYMAHMAFEHDGRKRDAVGATLPGIPFLILGRNDRLAWGLTSTGLDSQDIFVEQINPDNEKQYRTESGWASFKTEDITIGLPDGNSEDLVRRVSRNGPILPDDFRGISSFLPPGHVASLKWTGLSEQDTTLDTLMLSTIANDTADFLLAAKYAVSPMNSAVVADVEGNIALVAPGLVPKRNPENLIAGRAPVPGWLEKYQWQGYLDTSEVPRIINPEKEAIATANANFLPPGYNHLITYDWAEHFRQARVEKLVVNAGDKHSVNAALEVMSDQQSEALVALRDFALQTMPRGVGRLSGVLTALRNWNGEMDVDKPEPLIMLAWFRHLHRHLLEDDLGSAYSLFERGRLTPLLTILRRSGARNWCDNKDTPVDESCAKTLELSLSDAIGELTESQGKKWQTWRYGKAHIAHGEHKPFGNVESLAKYFNVMVPSGGGPYTLHRGQTDFSKEGPYRNRHAAGYRAIYDLSDLDQSLFVISTGQSGHVMSPHYSDFADRWADSEFVTISTQSADYSKDSTGTLVFKP